MAQPQRHAPKTPKDPKDTVADLALPLAPRDDRLLALWERLGLKKTFEGIRLHYFAGVETLLSFGRSQVMTTERMATARIAT